MQKPAKRRNFHWPDATVSIATLFGERLARAKWLRCKFLGAFGAPSRIRTCDLCLRRAALYPAELWVPRASDSRSWLGAQRRFAPDPPMPPTPARPAGVHSENHPVTETLLRLKRALNTIQAHIWGGAAYDDIHNDRSKGGSVGVAAGDVRPGDAHDADPADRACQPAARHRARGPRLGTRMAMGISKTPAPRLLDRRVGLSHRGGSRRLSAGANHRRGDLCAGLSDRSGVRFAAHRRDRRDPLGRQLLFRTPVARV